MIELMPGARVFTENGVRVELCESDNGFFLLVDSRSTPLGVWAIKKCYAEIGEPLQVYVEEKESGWVLLTEFGDVVNVLRLGPFKTSGS
jgi:hypothetical protein